jgi:hypothetical protein
VFSEKKLILPSQDMTILENSGWSVDPQIGATCSPPEEERKSINTVAMIK